MEANKQVDQQPTVLNLCGWSGTGKTTFLKHFAQENPGSIQIISPSTLGAAFDLASADFGSHAAVALDEVMMWERNSTAAAIAALEREALAAGKKLILVTQGREDLSLAGIQLTTVPMVVQLHGRQDALNISFNGKSLHFAKPGSGLTHRQ